MKNPHIFYLSKILILTAFYFIVYNTHITKITEHISIVWIVVMLVAQILSLTYATINDLTWDRVMASTYIIGILYIIYIKLHYEMNTDIELKLREKHILE